ncbi:MAG TPA: enoyl-CoA hydratase-related protein [Steroidobacteraceae bacterium]|nr:enoyl-CoA hydratase-related protein [Steroidobacteraceae bacterium]
MSEQVLKTCKDGVCELRFDRPEKRNAITHHMYQAFAAHLHAALADHAVRAVLLSGAGASFSAGNDLNDFLTGPEFTSAHPVMDVLRTLATFDKPLVAAVHGPTIGIGVTMLLHCDLVVAAQGTQLLMPFVALGLVPEAGSSLLLPRLVGTQRAAELLLLGQPLDAAEAQRLGLVNRVVEADKLLDEASSLARRLAEQPVDALRATKRLLRGDAAELLARIEAEAQAFGARLKSEEFRAQVRAVLAKGRG